MKTLSISSDGSGLNLTGGSLFVEGRDAAAVIVRARLRTLKGECAEDPGLGLNFRETDPAIRAAEAKAVIAMTVNGDGDKLVKSQTVTASQDGGQLRLDVSVQIDDDAAGISTVDQESPEWGSTTWAGSMWL